MEKITVTYTGNDFGRETRWLDPPVEVYLFRPNITIELKEDGWEDNLAFRTYGHDVKDNDIIDNDKEEVEYYSAYIPKLDKRFIEENTELFKKFFEGLLM